MDRADIVPVELDHPDPFHREKCPDLRNFALAVAFSPVELAMPAYTFTQALIQRNQCSRFGRFAGVLSPHPTQCGIFFALTTIETIYVALEVAGQKAKVDIVWHSVLTEEEFREALPHEPQLEVIRSLVDVQPQSGLLA